MRDERPRPGGPPSAVPPRRRPPLEGERARVARSRAPEPVEQTELAESAAAPRGARRPPSHRPPRRRSSSEGSAGGPALAVRLLPRSRWGILALGGAVLGVAFMVMALIDGGTPAPAGVSVRSGSRAALVAAGVARSDSPLKSSNYVSSLEELHRLFGEPPEATLGRMRIPSLKIDAPLSARAVPEGGQMPNPIGPDDIAYYDFAGLRGYGGFPGKGGNAVFAGHVDEAAHLDYAGLDYLGPGVFFNLRNIARGDTIEVDVGDGPVKYKVRWVREVELESGDWKTILGSDVSIESITLITCGGDFSESARAYTSRTVVRAERS